MTLYGKEGYVRPLRGVGLSRSVSERWVRGLLRSTEVFLLLGPWKSMTPEENPCMPVE